MTWSRRGLTNQTGGLQGPHHIEDRCSIYELLNGLIREDLDPEDMDPISP